MTPKIMIVDDEENIRELLVAVLMGEGFETISVESGKNCLEALKTEKPNLILMDMMMPVMSGRETVEIIRENPKTKELKIAFLTVVNLSEKGNEQLKELNCVDYIQKPFDNGDLVKRVKKIVA